MATSKDTHGYTNEPVRDGPAPNGAQKIYRENSQQFLSMESRHFDYIIASEKFNTFL